MAIETSPILMAKFMKKIHFFRPKDVPSRKEVSFFLLRMARLQFMRSSAGSAPTSLNWNNTTQGGEKEPGYGQLFLVREVPPKKILIIIFKIINSTSTIIAIIIKEPAWSAFSLSLIMNFFLCFALA